MDSSSADALEWTDSTVWEKVRTLVFNLHFPYIQEDVKVAYFVSPHLKMEELDSPESLTEENGVRKQTSVVRKKREVRKRRYMLATCLYIVLFLQQKT